MKKRFLSILLALVLCLGLVPVTALAADPATLEISDVRRIGETSALINVRYDMDAPQGEKRLYYAVTNEDSDTPPTIDTSGGGGILLSANSATNVPITLPAEDANYLWAVVLRDDVASRVVKHEIPQTIVLNNAFEHGNLPTTDLPATFDYDLADCKYLYSVHDGPVDVQVAGKPLKIVTTQDNVYLNVSFTNKEESDPVGCITVWYDASHSLVRGQQSPQTVWLETAGTYYILLSGGANQTSGEYHAELSLMDTSGLTRLSTALDGLTETTTLPLSEEFQVGSDGVLYNSEGLIPVVPLLGKLYRVQATTGDMLNVSFEGKNAGQACTGFILDENKQKLAEGPYMSLKIPETGTYYVVMLAPEWAKGQTYRAEMYWTRPVELSEVVKDLPVTALPTEFDYTLGDEEEIYTIDGSEYAGKLVKVEVDDSSKELVVWFGGKTDDINTKLFLLDEQGNKIQERNDNNWRGDGEMARFTVAEAGTYVLGLFGYDLYESGACTAKIYLADPLRTLTVAEAIAETTETTTLPTSLEYTLGSENVIYSGLGNDGSSTAYGKVLKLELEANSLLEYSMYGTDWSIDTQICLFNANGTRVSRQDYDNKNGNGEIGRTVVTEAGTYYLFLCGYNDSDVGECTGSMSVMALRNDEPLDFTDSTNLPQPGPDALWSWDETSHTLTLRDGFSLQCQDEDEPALTIPGDTTIVVEGDAELFAANYGIYCPEDGEDSAVTIRGRGKEVSQLFIQSLSDCDGMYWQRYGLNIENCSLGMNVGDDGLDLDGSLRIVDSRVDIVSDDDAIKVDDGQTEVIRSQLSVDAGGRGLWTQHKGNVTVTDSELSIVAEDEPLDIAGALRIENSVFDLVAEDDYDDVLEIRDSKGFALPGTFRLFDRNGDEFYTGTWDDKLLQSDSSNSGTVYFLSKGTDYAGNITRAVSCFTVTVKGSGAEETGAGLYGWHDWVQVETDQRGASFTGWTSDDVEVENANQLKAGFEMPAHDVTVTANYGASGGSGGGVSTAKPITTYPPTIRAEEAGGTVTTTPANPKTGDTVTIKPQPKDGKEVDQVTVTDRNGDPVAVKDNGDGTYSFIQPTGAVTIRVSFRDGETAPEPGSELSFTDVPAGAYYAEAVRWAVENGVTSGLGNGLFGPDGACTRAQIVTFLWRVMGSPEPASQSGMADVAADAYYAKAVAWAVEQGITSGTGENRFSPDKTCTRAEAVALLFRAIQAETNGTADFSDVPADSYFAQAVAWAAANGVTSGIGNGLFGPGLDCTRAQIVCFLYRVFGNK